MRFILHTSRSFPELAAALGAYGLGLDGVRACTFPGRPEPRSARFVHPPTMTPYFDYQYVPDLEVRALGWLTMSLPDIEAAHIDLDALLSGIDATDTRPWFESWHVLREALYTGAHQSAQRAAACWCMRGKWSKEDAPQCVEVLLEAICEGSLSARRACAEQLASWPRLEAREVLVQVYEREQDLEVRASARRALDQIDALDVVGRR